MKVEDMELMEKALSLVLTFRDAIDKGYTHYRQTTGELLPDVKSILNVLQKEGAINIEPPKIVDWGKKSE